MAGENAIDLDKPETWPDDIGELESLTGGIPDPEDAPGDKGKTTDSDDDDKLTDEEKAAAQKVEEEEKAKADADAAKVADEEAAAAKAAEEAEAAAAAAKEKEEEELPIATRDGKQTIPFEVLQQERQKARDAIARNTELEAELEAARKVTPVDKTVVTEEEAEEFVVTEAMQAKADQLKEDWGEDIAEQHINSLRIAFDNEQLRKKIDSLETETSRTSAASKQREETVVQAAIDNSPDMLAWQSGDAAMYDRSLTMHDTLMGTDPTYAAMTWEERFQALPSRVRAAYGMPEPKPKEDPPKPKEDPPAKTPEEIEAEAKAAADKAVAEGKPPNSMSDLPKGDTPIEKTPIEALEGLDSVDIQKKMLELSESDPVAYERYINSLM